MISDSVELLDTDVCFLHIQQCGRMFDFQRCTRSHPRLNLSLQGNQKNLSLGLNPIDNAEPCYSRDNLVGSHLCDECMKSNELIVCHKLLSMWGLLARVVLTDHRMSGEPIRAKYGHVKTICERTLDGSPTGSSSSFLKW